MLIVMIALSAIGTKEKNMNEDAQNKTETEPLLTLKEVRAILKAGRTKVWRCCNAANKSDRLITVNMGGLVRVRPSDLQDFINRHRN